MTRIDVHRLLQVLLWALLALCLGPRPLHAHGGEGRLVVESAPVGAWSLSAWMTPDPLRPGEVHMAVSVTDEGQPVTDCQVRVSVTPLDGQQEELQAVAGPATAATAYRHEAALLLQRDGRYRLTIDVVDTDGKAATHSFEAFVRPVSLPMNVLIWGQLALAPLVGLWLLREGLALYRRRRQHD
jgi:hypothetical protein